MAMRPIPGGSRRSFGFNLLALTSGVMGVFGGVAAFNGSWDRAQFDVLVAIVLILWAMAWDD